MIGFSKPADDYDAIALEFNFKAFELIEYVGLIIF